MDQVSMHTKDKNRQQGFTLVELSIVLVIIGLIVSGVLIGQNMIRAAEIRSVIAQIEKYNSAVNTFRSKYGGIPGDFNQAVRFGLGSTNGDGDGLIEDSDGGAPDANFLGEVAEIWNQLSNANMMEDSITLFTTGGTPTVGTNFPAAKSGVGGVLAYTDAQFNYWHIGALTPGAPTDAITGIDGDTLLPEDAYTIDLKMDDGVSSAGTVIAMTADFAAYASLGGEVTTDCVVTEATPIDYDVLRTTRLCLRLRMM